LLSRISVVDFCILLFKIFFIMYEGGLFDVYDGLSTKLVVIFGELIIFIFMQHSIYFMEFNFSIRI
jgi:hypothetical protein